MGETGDSSGESLKEEAVAGPYTFTTRKLLGQDEGPRAVSSPKDFTIPASTSPFKHKYDDGESNSDDNLNHKVQSPVPAKRLNLDLECDKVTPVNNTSLDNDNQLGVSESVGLPEVGITEVGGDGHGDMTEFRESPNDSTPSCDSEVKGSESDIAAESHTNNHDDTSDKTVGDNTPSDASEARESHGEGVEGVEGVEGAAGEISPSPTQPAVESIAVTHLSEQAISTPDSRPADSADSSVRTASDPAACAGCDSGYSSQNTVLTPEPNEQDAGKEVNDEEVDILDIATGLEEDGENSEEGDSTEEPATEPSMNGDMDEGTGMTNVKVRMTHAS